MAYLLFNSSGKAVSDTGKVFPLQYKTEGGARVPYVPTKNDMKNCGYADLTGGECPRKIGGSAPLMNCADCSLHPGNIPSRK